MFYKIFTLFITISLLFGCATTYKAPIIAQKDFTRSLDASVDKIFKSAKQILVQEGYQIQSSDKEAGVISTAKKQTKLTETDVDCGTTMGLPYIKDNRTSTTVAIGIIMSDNKITIKPAVEGSYLKGNVAQGIDLKCVSLGSIEENLFNKIKTNI